MGKKIIHHSLVSIVTYFFLLSGKLLENSQPRNWQSPWGNYINGDKMFEEAFLTQLFWLVQRELVNLNFAQKTIYLKKGKAVVESLPPFTSFLLKPLPTTEEMEIKSWIKLLGIKSGNLNPARDIFKLVEQEADQWKETVESKILFLKLKSRIWSKEKLNLLSKNKLEEIKQLWQEGQSQEWWEFARKQLKYGLTFLRLNRVDNDKYDS